MVSIGKGSVVGAGAIILPELAVGLNSVVGAGAVVTRDVPDNCLVFGNPARIIRKDISGYKDKAVP
jgi:acetyltransferase-like isoleucine patch superfamily enzyme